jgi:hypothetical protein
MVVLAFTDDRCAGCKDVRALGQIGNTIGQSTGFAVATGLSRPAAKKMVRTRHGRYIQFLPTAADPHGALARKYGVTSLPTIVVIDRAGRLAARFEQPPTPQALQDVLDKLQPEPIPADVDAQTRPHLSVFDTPVGAVRSLPAHLRPTTAPCPFVRDSVRQIGKAGDTRVLIARTLDGGLLLATATPNGGGGTGCGTTASIPSLRARELARIAHRGIVTALGTSGPGHSPLYALIVVDGYTTAEVNGTAFPVRRNGVVITGVGTATYVTLSGPAGSRRVKIFG